jgi:citrate lyase subunit beta / citryl-CoA lyase
MSAATVAPAPTVRSWLYVPAHRADRVAKALRAGADAVVLDLQDAVPPADKATARETALRVLAERDPATGPRIWVRINDPEGPDGAADLDGLAGSAADGLRVPRTQDPSVVRDVADRAGRPLQLLVETALGLVRAAELAAAHPLVAGLGLGETDLAADLGVLDDDGLVWARGAVVVAARAAGLPAPVQSVWTDVADLDGLRASSERGRGTGFAGRSVIHPRQIPVVHRVYTPDAATVAAARRVLAAAEQALERGEVAALDEGGRFVDPAVVARARTVLARAETTPPPAGDPQ